MDDPVSELQAALAAAAAELRGSEMPQLPHVERPPKPDFGDYSTNAAMLLAPALGEAPRAIAERLGGIVGQRLSGQVSRVDVAGPGFLNLFMSDAWCRDALGHVLSAGDRYGSGVAPAPERVLVEFVSANPTGPITVASGRHAAYGDSLARVLEFAGHTVEREYYVNDGGSQIDRFGESIQARARGEEPPEDGYHGDYVRELAERIPGAAERPAGELALEGVELMLEQIRGTLERFRVRHDRFFSERSLYETRAVERAISVLEEREHLYPSDGAVWLRSTTFGDDKDRVVMRSSGEYTYLGSDIAYHEDKLERGYGRAINVLGADHHGYIARIRAAWQALGGGEDTIELSIMQLVNLLERGERVQMSKRAGAIVTLDELLDDIGVDAARFFLLQRSHDTTLDLDLSLAREHTADNPVYYVQYAHARIASIIRKVGRSPDDGVAGADHDLHPSERALVKRLLEWPEEVAVASERRAPHRLTAYAHDLAQDFSAFYRDCKVAGSEAEAFRLSLCAATQRVIARALDLLGVEAPETM